MLSKQKAKVDHLNEVYSVDDIVDVAAFNDGVVVHLVGGILLQVEIFIKLWIVVEGGENKSVFSQF